MYFQMKKSALQTDQADRRYTGFEQEKQNSVRRLHLIAVFLNFSPFKRRVSQGIA